MGSESSGRNAKNGMIFPLRQDPEVAIPHFDEASEKRKLWLSGIPFVLLVVMLAIMCLGMKIQKRMEKDDDEE